MLFGLPYDLWTALFIFLTVLIGSLRGRPSIEVIVRIEKHTESKE